MNKPRIKIESYKDQLRKQIEDDALRYKRAIIRELDYAYRQVKNSGSKEPIEDLFDKVIKRLRVPVAASKLIEKDLKEAQEQIATEWDNYFEKEIKAGDKITFNDADYEKLVAAHQVNFGELDDTLKTAVETEFKKSIRSEYGYNTLRSKLVSKDLGDFQASTLANTAVAQFDNAYMVENSQQAGVEKFLYDGTIKANTREFCLKHFHKTYTLAQLRALDNGQGLPVLYSLGGYNCTHFLTPVFE